MGSLRRIGGPADFLRQPLNGLVGLRPLPWKERLFLRRNFQGEEIKIGPSQEWLGRSWDLRVAAVKGTIFKVAVEAGASDRPDAESLSMAVHSLFEKELGPPSQPAAAAFLWDAEDGNAVLQLANVGGERQVMVFFTSNIAHSFTPR